MRNLSHTEAAVHSASRKCTLLNPVVKLVGSGTRTDSIDEETKVHTETSPEARVHSGDDRKTGLEVRDVLVLKLVKEVRHLDIGTLTEFSLSKVINVIVEERRVTLYFELHLTLDVQVVLAVVVRQSHLMLARHMIHTASTSKGGLARSLLIVSTVRLSLQVDIADISDENVVVRG